jgi:predicted secreted protein
MAALALAAADPTPPAPTAAASPASAEKPAAKDTDVVCWTEAVTGSHYPRKVCSTRAQIEQQRRQDQAFVAARSRAQAKGGFGN